MAALTVPGLVLVAPISGNTSFGSPASYAAMNPGDHGGRREKGNGRTPRGREDCARDSDRPSADNPSPFMRGYNAFIENGKAHPVPRLNEPRVASWLKRLVGT